MDIQRAPITLTLSLAELQFVSALVHQHSAANYSLKGVLRSLETAQRCYSVIGVIDPLIKKAAADEALRRVVSSQIRGSLA
jgi:hypothetical protein